MILIVQQVTVWSHVYGVLLANYFDLFYKTFSWAGWGFSVKTCNLSETTAFMCVPSVDPTGSKLQAQVTQDVLTHKPEGIAINMKS